MNTTETLCTKCANNTQPYPFIQCMVEPMFNKEGYIRVNKLFLTKKEYKEIMDSHKYECINYSEWEIV